MLSSSSVRDFRDAGDRALLLNSGDPLPDSPLPLAYKEPRTPLSPSPLSLGLERHQAVAFSPRRPPDCAAAQADSGELDPAQHSSSFVLVSQEFGAPADTLLLLSYASERRP